MNAPKLVSLKCPACQTALPARPGELLFACPKCATAVEGTSDGLVTVPLAFEAGDRPWWSLGGVAKVRQFAASQPASTPFGQVASDNQTLKVRFLIPADARPIVEVYRAALDSINAHPRTRERSGSVKGGTLGRRAAEQIARQLFLTLVARADGKVHHIDFVLELPEASILVRAS